MTELWVATTSFSNQNRSAETTLGIDGFSLALDFPGWHHNEDILDNNPEIEAAKYVLALRTARRAETLRRGA